MIKAVLFDLDGTLINTNHLIMESFKYTIREKLNIEMEEEKIIRFFGEPLAKSMKSLDASRAEELTNFYKQYNEAKHDELAEEFEGVEEAVKMLKNNGIKLGIVTSKRRALAERGLRLIRLYDYMDVIVTPEDTDKHKPDGAPLVLACSKLGISPEEAIMVGDSIYDLQCGINGGSKTCAVSYSIFPIEELKSYNPDYIVDNLLELVDIVGSEIGENAV